MRKASARLDALSARLGNVTLLILAYLLVLAVTFLSLGAGDTRLAMVDIGILPLGAAAASLALLAAKAAPDHRTRLAWSLIAAAMALQLFGDAAWFWFEVIQGTDPYPSVADVGYIGLYPLLLAGLLSLPVRRRTGRDALILGLDIATVALGGFMLVWWFSLGTAVEDGVHSLEAALDAAYPLGDLVLVVGAAGVALRGVRGSTRAAMRTLLAGLLVWVAADLAFSYFSQQRELTGGTLIDLGWCLALACFAIGAEQDRRARHGRAPAGGSAIAAPSATPYVALLGGSLILGRSAFDLPLVPYGGLLTCGLLMTVSVAFRQMLASAGHADLGQRYQQRAITDDLTQLLSRPHFMECAQQVLERARLEGGTTAALVVDVDRFKQVNDTHGHLAGDAVLATVASRCVTALRANDLVCRFGGDELVALLPASNLATAELCASRIVEAVQATAVDAGDVQVPVSVSVGVATAQPGGELGELLSLADRGLYTAKRNGRARTGLAVV